MKLIRISTAVGMLWLLSAIAVSAALVVQVAPPKNTGSKIIVKLNLQNTYSEKIQSVRAVIFLLNDQGKVVGQSTSWIIGGGKNKPSLDSNAKTTYNFVVTTDKPFTKTKLIITRMILDGGKLASLKDVQITDASK
ncbi:MAG TPA: hypothetical protein VHG89_12845 [Verrucomicrobiae bacterium]|nr:hypothetical protein [Verrucomicrobiae bacterium]